MEKPRLRSEEKKSGSGSAEPDDFTSTESNHFTSTESNLPDAKLRDDSGDDSVLFPTVAIGASAGGVEALQRLFKSLPPDNGIAYIVVVHLAPERSSHLAEILATATSMPVIQVLAHTVVKPDTAYVIPPNYKMFFDRGMLRLEELSQPRPMRKAIDHLFLSLAEEQEERAICIVLTGADHDGTIGLKAIKAAGGMSMAQLPQTAQHPSMPESAVDNGVVDYVLPIEEMGKALTEYIYHSGLWQRKNAIPKEDDIQVLEEIISLLRTGGGGDFRGYKEGMLMRRAKRRMANGEWR